MTVCYICGVVLDFNLQSEYRPACIACAKQIFLRDAYFPDHSEQAWLKWNEICCGKGCGFNFIGHPQFDWTIEAIKVEYGTCSQCGYSHWVPPIQLEKTQ
jgi:hypothetical protein